MTTLKTISIWFLRGTTLDGPHELDLNEHLQKVFSARAVLGYDSHILDAAVYLLGVEGKDLVIFADVAGRDGTTVGWIVRDVSCDPHRFVADCRWVTLYPPPSEVDDALDADDDRPLSRAEVEAYADEHPDYFEHRLLPDGETVDASSGSFGFYRLDCRLREREVVLKWYLYTSSHRANLMTAEVALAEFMQK